MTNQEFYKYFSENKLYVTSVYNNKGIIEITIEDGDWKHEHLYCEHLMREIGYRKISEEIIDDNGSDTYSSKHYYVKGENQRLGINNI